MPRPNTRTRHALLHFALAVAACAAAAAVWSQGRPETGLLLDARAWAGRNPPTAHSTQDPC
jgi:hypothetical protein